MSRKVGESQPLSALLKIWIMVNSSNQFGNRSPQHWTPTTKPVPVNFRRLNNPRRDMMVVAAAGPGTNLVLALIGAVLVGLLLPEDAQVGVPLSILGFALFMFISINLFLALFNLIPLPPFDGSHIVEGLLPDDAARAYARLRPYGLPLLFFLLLIVPWLFPGLGIVERFVLPPVEWTMEHILMVARAIAGA